MNLPSAAFSIFVHSLKRTKWPNMIGPAEVSRITGASASPSW